MLVRHNGLIQQCVAKRKIRGTVLAQNRTQAKTLCHLQTDKRVKVKARIHQDTVIGTRRDFIQHAAKGAVAARHGHTPANKLKAWKPEYLDAGFGHFVFGSIRHSACDHHDLVAPSRKFARKIVRVEFHAANMRKKLS